MSEKKETDNKDIFEETPSKYIDSFTKECPSEEKKVPTNTSSESLRKSAIKMSKNKRDSKVQFQELEKQGLSKEDDEMVTSDKKRKKTTHSKSSIPNNSNKIDKLYK